MGPALVMVTFAMSSSCLRSVPPSVPVAVLPTPRDGSVRARLNPIVVDPGVETASELSPSVLASDRESSAKGQLVSLVAGLEPSVATRPWKYIVLHHTATEQGDVAAIHEAHRQRTDGAGRPWLGIGYHFVVGNGQGMTDGLVEPTFRWIQQLQGAHAAERDYNERGIGVCLVGDFTQQPPTPRQVATTRRLVGALVERFRIATSDVVRHQDVTATECPGMFFPMEEITGRSPPVRLSADRWGNASPQF